MLPRELSAPPGNPASASALHLITLLKRQKVNGYRMLPQNPACLRRTHDLMTKRVLSAFPSHDTMRWYDRWRNVGPIQSCPIPRACLLCKKCALCVRTKYVSKRIFRFPPLHVTLLFSTFGRGEARRSEGDKAGRKEERNNAAPPTPKLCPCLRLQEMMMCGDVDGSIKIEIGRPCRAKKVPMVLFMLRPGQQRSLRMQKRPKQAQAGCQAKKR